GVEEVARGVAREHAPCAVAAVRPWGQAHDHQARFRVTEAGHRRAPVLFVPVRATLLAGHLLAVLGQPRAEPAPGQLGRVGVEAAVHPSWTITPAPRRAPARSNGRGPPEAVGPREGPTGAGALLAAGRCAARA